MSKRSTAMDPSVPAAEGSDGSEEDAGAVETRIGKRRPARKKDGSQDDIAVIGMACRFPGANNYEEFWQSLQQGVFSVTEIPEERWNKEEYYSPNREDKNKSVSKWGGFIQDIDKFDASLFKISPREAELMDPQQRIMLELTWSCMEDAGYAPSEFRGSQTGVYIGVCNFDYKEIVERSLSSVEGHVSTGIHTTLIPNRISYEFDLRGPSMPIDTACSSSLVALNEAVHALQRGDCSAALVGAVSVLCSPTHFVSFSKTGMLSPEGICKTFDEGANGYVRGEGAGLVLLKPLHQAQQDKDTIYGVIKGVSVNHGGKVSTVTSPNPFAQSQVLVNAFQNADISPANVNYIEAHGTGTPKGDPIEVNALKRAFSSLEKMYRVKLPERSCGIGSVKTNIGHLEAVSGMAGIIKVLLSMKHQTLPALLHFRKLNSRINLEGSPFYIVSESQRWEAVEDGLRRAGVSSFGFGGVNAHVLLEEYPNRSAIHPGDAGTESSQPLLFLLSAKSKDCLKRYAKKLFDYLDERDGGTDPNAGLTFSLESFVYSLQKREAMEERIAFGVDSFSQLKEKLKSLSQGDPVEGSFRGNTKEGQEIAEFMNSTEDMTSVLKTWASERQLEKIGKLWVKGVFIKDWDLYYKNSPSGRLPPKVRLPTYPFSKKRYWIEEVRHLGQTTPLAHQPKEHAREDLVLHPLLHQNTSNLFEQRFSSVFTGEEFFLKDHQVNGKKVLPGVAYLEMAYAAIQHASGRRTSFPHQRIQLKNVVWIRSITVSDAPVEVHIGLFPQETDGRPDGYLSYEIYTGNREYSAEGEVPGEAFSVHSQGKARLLASGETPWLNLSDLQKRLGPSNHGARQYYEAFKAMGFDYGPAHRGLDQVYAGKNENGLPEVLAKLTLPPAVSGTRDRFILHPSLLDSALQASMGMGGLEDGLGASTAPLRPMLPFAVQSLEIMDGPFRGTRGLPESLWAWVRRSKDHRVPSASTSSAARDSFQERMTAPLDIDLCDDEGRVYVAMRGFSFRSLETDRRPAVSSKMDTTGLLMARPAWKEHIADDLNANHRSEKYADHRVIFAGSVEGEQSGVQRKIQQLRSECAGGDRSHIVFYDLDARAETLPEQGVSATTLDRRFEASAIALFEMIQHIARGNPQSPKPKEQVLLQVVVPATGSQQVYSALSGLLKTAHWENPKIVGQVIAVGADEPTGGLMENLLKSSRCPENQLFRYEGDNCWIGSFEEVKKPHPLESGHPEELPWKERGVYLITGGAGGLGKIFAQEIAERVDGATLILTGRSELSREKKTNLERLHRSDVNVEYQILDICDRQAVDALVRDILKRHGGLNGIIHCAGIVRDNFITKKTKKEFRDVLAPKVGGVVNLDEATKDISLDFFVLFSSTSGALGNVGQADYATANAFMDAFSRYRNSLRSDPRGKEAPRRSGHTVSINWPLWQKGGMRVDTATEQMMKDRIGMVALTTRSGIDAFYRSLASAESQVMVVEGVVDQMKRKLLSPPEQSRPKIRSTPAQNGELLDKIQDTLLHIASKLLKLKVEDLDVNTELSEYGFDSITLTGFATRLSEKYGIDLAPTVFFDYPTIESFAKYLSEEYRADIAEPDECTEEPVSDLITSEVEAEPVDRLARDRTVRPRYTKAHTASQEREAYEVGRLEVEAGGPIAIVGMSGRFPKAPDLSDFWNNLKEGKDCISEIPRHRWDWQALYGDPNTEINKSNIRWGGFIDGVDEFDPLFFGISPREARLMDPQQRLLMAYVWLAIEDAGYSAASLSGSNTGIFVGTASTGYSSLIAKSNIVIEGFSATGTVPSVGPNRMSYFLNFHGPSEPIETACSSSLVAIHRAIVAMETGDCDQAIVGGVNTIVAPELHVSFNKAGMLSQDGRCKTFSKDANGYARGEGVGMLFLKRLRAAEEAGDHIYGIIRASAENHGGRANSLTSPNSKAQADLLVKAYKKAGIDPRTVTYLETHGTGTALGDPIEINGIKTAFKTLYQETENSGIQNPRCALGSVKTNVGHLELAAGVAGVIKVLLQFRHQQIVQSLHCDEINPYIDLNETPFYIAQESEAWKALRDSEGKEIPRRAGVSSFGFGGANAHVVLEEYVPAQQKVRDSSALSSPVLIPLSAKNPDCLRTYAGKLLEFIRESAPSPVALRDLAYTFQVGRDAMEERLGMIVHSTEDLQDKLQGFLDGREEIQDLYLGQVKRNKEVLAAFANDEDLQTIMEVWINKGKYGKFLGLWVKGMAFDWNKLHSEGLTGKERPNRITAPTYPFTKECFWVDSPLKHKQAEDVERMGGRVDGESSPEFSHQEDPVLKVLEALEKGSFSIDEAITAISVS